MENLRILLMSQGRLDSDYIIKMKKPCMGEFISIKKEDTYTHYEVCFIQYVFNEKNIFEYVLITAINK